MNSCLQCGKEIPEGKKFCNSSCSAKYNNSRRVRKPWTQEQREKASKSSSEAAKVRLALKDYTKYRCSVCGKETTLKDIHKGTKLSYRYCSQECKDLAIQQWKSKLGGYRKGSGRGKRGEYKGIWCDSTWELAFLIYHLDHNIPIRRCTDIRTYTFEGKEYKYFPDFIVRDSEVVEIKGFVTPRWKSKEIQNPDIRVLYGKDIQPYLEYVHDKYTFDLESMYENRQKTRPVGNRSWVHNDKENRLVLSKDLDQILSKGWIRGRLKNKK